MRPYDRLLAGDAAGLPQSLSPWAFSATTDRDTRRPYQIAILIAEGGKNIFFPKDSVFPLHEEITSVGEAKEAKVTI